MFVIYYKGFGRKEFPTMGDMVDFKTKHKNESLIAHNENGPSLIFDLDNKGSKIVQYYLNDKKYSKKEYLEKIRYGKLEKILE